MTNDIVTLYYDPSVCRLVTEPPDDWVSTRHGYYDNSGNFIEHYEYGPAYICDTGHLYYIHGKEVTYFAETWLKERNIDSDPNNMTEEDKLALSFFMRSLI